MPLSGDDVWAGEPRDLAWTGPPRDLVWYGGALTELVALPNWELGGDNWEIENVDWDVG